MSPARPRLLLASASPRRRQLLADAGYDFEVVSPQVAEIHDDRFTLRELTACNALRKGLAAARAHPGHVVLAADTLVALEDQLIGKPADRAEAVRLLKRLSGRTHRVASSVFLGDLRAGKSISFTVLSHVTFKKLSARLIEGYLRRIDPLDKAGGYAAQGEGKMIIARIDGSRSNVIGLPMEKTREALELFAIHPRA